MTRARPLFTARTHHDMADPSMSRAFCAESATLSPDRSAQIPRSHLRLALFAPAPPIAPTARRLLTPCYHGSGAWRALVPRNGHGLTGPHPGLACSYRAHGHVHRVMLISLHHVAPLRHTTWLIPAGRAPSLAALTFEVFEAPASRARGHGRLELIRSPISDLGSRTWNAVAISCAVALSLVPRRPPLLSVHPTHLATTRRPSATVPPNREWRK